MNELLMRNLMLNSAVRDKAGEVSGAGDKSLVGKPEENAEGAGEKTAEQIAADAAAAEKAKESGHPEKKDEPLTGKTTEKPAEPLTIKDLALPEGVTIDEALGTKFLGIVNDAKLDAKARANALIALQVEATKAASERNSVLWQETQEAWKTEAKALPEIGGAKLPETLAGIRKLLDAHGTPELDDVFDLTGAGNNPHMIKFLAKVATFFAEGKPLSGSPATGPRDAATIMYPNQGKK